MSPGVSSKPAWATEQENTSKSKTKTKQAISSLIVTLTFSATALPFLPENQQGSLPETGEPEQGRKPQASRGGGLRDPPDFHPRPGPAQFLRETTVPQSGRPTAFPQLGCSPTPFQGHEVMKRLGSCHPLSGVCSAMLGRGTSGQHVFLGSSPAAQPAAGPSLLLGFQLPKDRVLPRLQPPWRLPPGRPVFPPC